MPAGRVVTDTTGRVAAAASRRVHPGKSQYIVHCHCRHGQPPVVVVRSRPSALVTSPTRPTMCNTSCARNISRPRSTGLARPCGRIGSACHPLCRKASVNRYAWTTRTVRRQQVIRPRGGTTRRRDDQEEQPISSAEEIGRLLRDAREERGLDLLAVHDRLSRPITLTRSPGERGPGRPPRPGPGPVHTAALRRLPRARRRCAGPADDRCLVGGAVVGQRLRATTARRRCRHQCGHRRDQRARPPPGLHPDRRGAAGWVPDRQPAGGSGAYGYGVRRPARPEPSRLCPVRTSRRASGRWPRPGADCGPRPRSR